MQSKWFSRKFLLSTVGVVVSVLITLGVIAPDKADAVVQTIMGVVGLVLSAVGYSFAEASIDKAKKGE